ncbi:hypothetical protein NQ315_014187 [Exocentrus adspersus]|uniref:Uncharacterized protein n=1 Tax=Exocentrus adspersus TaxID=1586481 RepID=A0AAV8VB34_9CUCU|nr:hypothetical protein NQ315_014187 [Exocentrus adspersus]
MSRKPVHVFVSVESSQPSHSLAFTEFYCMVSKLQPASRLSESRQSQLYSQSRLWFIHVCRFEQISVQVPTVVDFVVMGNACVLPPR